MFLYIYTHIHTYSVCVCIHVYETLLEFYSQEYNENLYMLSNWKPEIEYIVYK